MACPDDGTDKPGSTQYGLPITTPLLTEEESLFSAGEKPLPHGENPSSFLEHPVADSLSSAPQPLRRLLHRLGESASTANP